MDPQHIGSRRLESLVSYRSVKRCDSANSVNSDIPTLRCIHAYLCTINKSVYICVYKNTCLLNLICERICIRMYVYIHIDM